MSWNRTVTCSHCYNEGHNRRSCPELKKWVENNPESYIAHRHKESQSRAKTRKCGYCKGQGHNRRSCELLQRDKRNLMTVNADFCSKVKGYLEDTGLGIGALVTIGESGDHAKVGMVSGFRWPSANFRANLDSYSGEFIKVKSVGTGREAWYRLSEDCTVFDTSHYGHILAVASPIASTAVRDQIPGDWVTGSMGIDAMFADQERNYGPNRSVNEYAEQNSVEIERD